MINKKWRIISIILLTVCAGWAVFVFRKKEEPRDVTREVTPSVGDIQSVITSTASVLPQNRLEVKPPINGRIDRILVKEGVKVKGGDVLAWMSSTERAALLDSARAEGPEALKHWEDVYKPTPLVSPIDGDVIVSHFQAGQVVTTADAVVVLSDRLIVQAQVDETDIGNVREGKRVVISLDAYPEIRVDGKVDHIYYESKVVNNVTIYQVDIVPETVPEVFRSGMSATVDIVVTDKDGVLLIPLEAVRRDKKGGAFVMIAGAEGTEPVSEEVRLGISDEKNAEVISGVTAGDRIVISAQKYTVKTPKKGGTNPFMPSRPGGGARGGK
ncbi:MAG: efflux RND transporter periplasmic adaptor subunit [Candidatus Omnitrophica bacterium]|nr:efflux RND transporter periplasmic adaptor subunit [Candidatus Omnitrophota bacterium]